MNEINLERPIVQYLRDYGKMPKVETAEGLIFQESVSYNMSFFETPAEEFDKFLSKRFGYTISDFRKMYISNRIPSLKEDEDKLNAMVQFVNPIPETITAFFLEANSLFEVMFKCRQTKKFVEQISNSGPLPLHNDNISNFTIIRARFSNLTKEKESLEGIQNDIFFGYFFSNEKFRFMINSSSQFDLTVIYEEI